MSETQAEKQFRLLLEARCRKIAEKIKGDMLPGTNFALFMFDAGPHGSLAYVATAERQGVVRMMLEWLAHVTSREILRAFDPNVVLRLAQRAAKAGGCVWEALSDAEKLQWLEITTTILEGIALP